MSTRRTPSESPTIICPVPRLPNDRGEPNFNVRFYAVRKEGAFGGAQMRGPGQMIVGDSDGVRLVEIPGPFDP